MKNPLADHKHTRPLLFLVVVLALLSSCAGPASHNSPLPRETAIPTSTIPPLPTVTAIGLPTANPNGRLSKPGEYQGYSQPLYNEWVKTSQYVTVRDGTKLAVDIYRPAQDGKPVSALTPELNPPPTIHLYHEADRASYIVLPIIPNP